MNRTIQQSPRLSDADRQCDRSSSEKLKLAQSRGNRRWKRLSWRRRGGDIPFSPREGMRGGGVMGVTAGRGGGERGPLAPLVTPLNPPPLIPLVLLITGLL
mmetsp:Transcript_31895/g.70896  ORF Transcript_31895/g.70896 Transcript_31895/m.70896 type:complete len:101 (+) Transcript_31895:53-355(+)